jgi:succinate---hydroxymethylglutarate CoA-transferase
MGAQSEDSSKSPLSGIRVLEFSQYAAGPYPGMLLGDLGADVVKVEPPEGDGLRNWPPHVDDGAGEMYSLNFASVNRNKRSIVLDLKTAEGVRRAKNLCRCADVVLENYRPGAMDRLGLGYSDLAREYPHLVYCSISGYGHRGPYKLRGAFDVTVQAISGLMSVTGEEGRPPVKCGIPVADFIAGVFGALGIVAALRQRDRTGSGTYVDCAMLDCLLSTAALQTAGYWGTGNPPERIGSRHPRNAPYQAFQASDKWFVIAAGTDKLWQEVCDAVQRPELAQDPRFATQVARAKNDVELATILEQEFMKRPAAHWLDEFERRGVPLAPVLDYAEILADDHVRATGLVQEMSLPGGAITKTVRNPLVMKGREFVVFRRPPRLGEHSDEVFDEWGAVTDEREHQSQARS